MSKLLWRYIMENNDTINLLKECDAGTKMAVVSIDEILEKTKDTKLRKILEENKEEHRTLGNEIHTLLVQHGSEYKEPSPMAKGMSWLKTNVKMSLDESDATVADLITDGCGMGIKTLNKHLNQYAKASNTAKGLCKKLISIEEKLCKELRAYL